MPLNIVIFDFCFCFSISLLTIYLWNDCNFTNTSRFPASYKIGLGRWALWMCMSMRICSVGYRWRRNSTTKKDRLILDMRFNFIQNVCYKLFLAFPKLVGFHQYRKNSKCEFTFHNDECSIYSIVWFFFFCYNKSKYH